MIFHQTEDMELVKQIMLMPEILKYAAEDEPDYNPVFTCDKGEAWLLAMDGDDFVGISYIHITGSAVSFFHTYILEKHNRKFKRMCRSFLKWFADNMPKQIIKLNTLMPSHAKAAFKIAISLGFTKEGTDRMSYRKYDKIWDRYHMGITRGEI